MRICVVGWYFYEPFYEALEKIWRYPVFVVKHRPGDVPFPSELVENRGLEWGAYNWYLQNKWPGDDKVLFTHDDIDITDPESLDDISKIDSDCTYIFCDSDQISDNGGRGRYGMGLHGRAFLMSKELLSRIKPEGFWFDEANTGYTLGKRPPEGMQDYNMGAIRCWEKMVELKKEGFNSLDNFIVPGYKAMRRGEKIR